jgi:hypothetical protein
MGGDEIGGDMSGNIDARLRKLELEAEQELNAPQIIILKANQDENLDEILEANNVKRTGHDLIISVSRGLGGEVPFLPFNERIISISNKVAA